MVFYRRKFREIYESEKKYVQALELMDTQILDIAKQTLSPDAIDLLFGHTSSLL